MEYVICGLADCIEVSFGFQVLIQFLTGEGRVTPEESVDRKAPVTSNNRFQHRTPFVGAGHIAVAQHCPFQIAELVEAEQGMVTGSAEVTVVQGTFLIPVGLAHGAVHVEDVLLDGLFFMDSIDPLAR